MGKFLSGFWKGFGRIVSYKLIGPVQVVDVLLIFSFVSGFINGWGNSSALTGWFLAAWFYMFLRLYEYMGAEDKQAIEHATEALKIAAEALDMQRDHIKYLEDTITALQTPKP